MKQELYTIKRMSKTLKEIETLERIKIQYSFEGECLESRYIEGTTDPELFDVIIDDYRQKVYNRINEAKKLLEDLLKELEELE